MATDVVPRDNRNNEACFYRTNKMPLGCYVQMEYERNNTTTVTKPFHGVVRYLVDLKQIFQFQDECCQTHLPLELVKIILGYACPPSAFLICKGAVKDEMLTLYPNWVHSPPISERVFNLCAIW